MGSQLIFLDTEFTNFSDARLISIGMAATTGEEFYMEVPYNDSGCSDFVKEVVVPLLGRGHLCSHDDLPRLVLDWLSLVKIAELVTICHDSEFDRTLLLWIFGGQLPNFIRLRCIGTRHINELLRHGFHVDNGYPEHHALYDAMEMRHAFREPLPFKL